MFILQPSEQAKAAIGKRVTVVDYPDGRLSIRSRGVALAYRTFDKIAVASSSTGKIADHDGVFRFRQASSLAIAVAAILLSRGR